MDVTTSNFSTVRSFIECELLPKVKFISYDVEFTGLKFQKWERDHINSLPYEKYRKLKYVAETYQILQLGLSFVVFDPQAKALKVYPYNFYLFPRSPIAYDRNLGMQLSCVKFNHQHGMDWNKWIGQGINYLKLSELPQLEDEEKRTTLQELLRTQYGDHHTLACRFIEVCEEVAHQQLGMQAEFPLSSNSFLLKTIQGLFQCLLRERGLELTLEITENKCLIKKVERKQREEYLSRMKEEKYGFGLLFDKVWKAQTAFVGHNCNLDLLYIYHHLIAPLPDNYFAYKEALLSSGNSFYDTKYIAIKHPEVAELGSRLEDLLKFLRLEKKESPLVLEGGYSRYSLQKQSLHEAGYDSYLTAWVFQQLMRRFDDVYATCKNRININLSFFFLSLGSPCDETNPEFASNLLRVNVPVGEGDDVRLRRQDCAKLIKQALADHEGQYALHEGFREIFLEIRGKRQPILKKVFLLLRKGHLKDVGTFASYFDWQKERVIRDHRKTQAERNTHFNKRPHHRNREDSEDPPATADQPREKERGDWKKQK